MHEAIIPHVFAALNSLERHYDAMVEKLKEAKVTHLPSGASVADLRNVLGEMRRVANKLQMESAKSDSQAANRSISVFYALNHMVRSEVISSLATFYAPDEEDTIKIQQALRRGNSDQAH